jgi:hypothetical protein
MRKPITEHVGMRYALNGTMFVPWTTFPWTTFPPTAFPRLMFPPTTFPPMAGVNPTKFGVNWSQISYLRSGKNDCERMILRNSNFAKNSADLPQIL